MVSEFQKKSGQIAKSYLAEGHFLKEPYIFRKAILIAYSRHLNEASEWRKKKDLLFEERSDEFKSFP